MSIAIGDKLPNVSLLMMGTEGPAFVELNEFIEGKKVALFGLPGAYTGTCTSDHVPSFIRTKGGFDSKGVDHVICIAVNDPFVMKAWSDSTGAGDAGLIFLSDAGAEFTKAIGMNFTAEPVGFYNRSKRFSLYAENGVVNMLNIDENPGLCEMSAGEILLEAI